MSSDQNGLFMKLFRNSSFKLTYFSKYIGKHSKMPHICPKPCGRLATATVFVIVSVIQFIAGLILLKSRYVYLLSGPDFWTAASNLAVGILLGVSAIVWKDVQKTSFKHIVRRNILASLVASAITINTTTAIILILGEGNTLLSIQLENDGKLSSKSEILAYSYATSVCSPIVSVVAAIVFLSGMWFRVGDKGMKGTPEIKSILKENSTNDYNWVFKGIQSPPKQNSKIVRKVLSFKSLSSSDDESFSLTDADLWSNTVHSIEYSKTPLRKGSHRTEMLRHSKVVQQESPCECDEHIQNTPENIPHETSRVSFANKRPTKKFIEFSPYAAQRHLETDSPPYPYHTGAKSKNANVNVTRKFIEFAPYAAQRHLGTNSPPYPDGIGAKYKIVNSLSFSDFKKMHRQNSKQRHKKKRMLLTEHPAFQQSKYLEGDINVVCFPKLAAPEVYIPRAHARMSSKSKGSTTTSDAEVEVHVNPKSQDYVSGNSSESPIAQYESEVAFCDALTGIFSHEKAKFPRASTLKLLNNSVASQPEDEDFVRVGRTSALEYLNNSGVSRPEDEDSVTRKVYRTSTAAGPSSSNISPLDISDIQTDSVIDQNEHFEFEQEKDTPPVASPQPTTSQIDSSIEVDDSFIDVTQPNVLAGEVVKVQVNSLPRTPFHSKLIPVPIPIISSAKKNTLKLKQKDAIAKASDKFSGRNEHHFSSFHGNLQAMNQGNPHIKANEENLVNQNYESVKDATVCEMSPDDKIPPSPAQTSGYDSAIFENAHFSGSESFKPNSSSSVTNSPYCTPKKKIQNFPSPRNLEIF